MKILLLIFTVTASVVQSTVDKPSTCTFPFTYKGVSYNDCIKSDSNRYWCSVYPIYNGTFSYCNYDGGEDIKDEQFLELMKKAQIHANRLNSLLNEKSEKATQCDGCINLLKSVSESITEQTSIFMDQNKRLMGLRQQHRELVEIMEEIKIYYQKRRCKETDTGAEYMGTLSVTISGKHCQRWDTQTPHAHNIKEKERFADNDMSIAKNYCRNPTVSNSPWCYTNDSQVEWEYCHVPKCGVDCRVDEKVNSSLPMCDNYQSSSCPKGSIFYNNGCYLKVSTPMNHQDAENECIKYNGNLVSVHSSAENIFLSKTFFDRGTSFFIGLNDVKKTGNYVYTDGSDKNYARFYAGEPNNAGGNEHCIEVGRYPAVPEAWNDIGCRELRPFICKIKF